MSEKKKTLRMKFTTDEGKKVSVSLAGCKEDIRRLSSSTCITYRAADELEAEPLQLAAYGV
jgi:hypothetical protein